MQNNENYICQGIDAACQLILPFSLSCPCKQYFEVVKAKQHIDRASVGRPENVTQQKI